MCCTLDIIYINSNTIIQFQSFSLCHIHFLSNSEIISRRSCWVFGILCDVGAKISRLKCVLWNLQLLRRQLFCSNRTSSSSSVDVDLYGRMGLSSLFHFNNNCQSDSNIKPYVHCQAAAVA